jgi:D-alanine-D-alanine ligase
MNKIYVVFGGPSSENEVSKGSKDLFVELLKKYKPSLIEWNKDKSFTDIESSKSFSFDDFLEKIAQEKAIFVNAMHGEYCEDGWIQERLEKYKIKFTGPNSKAARNSMDKYKSQALVKNLIKTIPTLKVQKSRKTLSESIKSQLPVFPIFLKPNAKGSSVNSFKINSYDELVKTWENLEDDTYLVQPVISGTEISIGTVFDGKRSLDLPPTEIIPKGAFFDYKSKYVAGNSKEITPARLSPELTAKVKELSIKIHKRLDLGCYSRTDMIIDKIGEIFFLESNSLPGFTKASLLPQQLRFLDMLDAFGEILLRNLN